ncbi:hypothetical protein BJ742DRAFT_860139 [Cladochytrium replicatum]|nr:hypothetical protein BJ742DRAFT_860139 [Cladochytrium replicatum]
MTTQLLFQSYELPLQHAASDNPIFQSYCYEFENDLDQATRWLDQVCKALRQYVEDMNRMNESTAALVTKLLQTEFLPKSGTWSTASQTLSDALQTVYALKQKLEDDLEENVISPLEQYLRTDVRTMKRVSKNYEKIAEKYEAAISKYSSRSKSKEASAAREEMFQLYDVRKLYTRASLEYGYRMQIFKENLEHFISDQLLGALASHADFASTNSELFKNIQPFMEGLRIRVDDGREYLNQSAAHIETEKRRLEEECINRLRVDDSPITTSNGQVNADTSDQLGTEQGASLGVLKRSPSKLLGEGIRLATEKCEPQSTVAQSREEKEGYLLKKVQKPIGPASWSRRYFSIKGGFLGYSFTPTFGKYRGSIVATSPVNVLLCNARPAQKEERKCCFEIYTVRRSFIVQAETNEDVQAWIDTLEAAKLSAATMSISNPPSCLLRGVSDLQTSTIDGEEEMSEDTGEKLLVFQSPSCRPAPLGRLDCSPSPPKLPDLPSRRSPTRPLNRSFSPALSTLLNAYDEDDEPERLAPGGRKVSDDSSNSRLKYPDSAMEKRDEEMHSLLKSVPASDHVLGVFPCALQKEIAIQGRVFLTQNRVCFHSNLLGFVTVLVVQVCDVINIVRKQTPFFGSITIYTVDGTHTFHAFLKDDVRMHAALHAVWMNITDSNPLKLQDLFHSLHKPGGVLDLSTRKMSDQSSGSGGQMGEAGVQSGEQLSGLNSAYQLPPEIPVPTQEVVCGCTEHFEKREVDMVLPIPAKHLFELLFGELSQIFWEKYHVKSGNTQLTFGSWADEGGQRSRDLKFIIPINNSMVKAKEADCQETQTVTKRDEFLSYTIELKSQTPSLPYGDTFSPISQYCITWVSSSSSRLVIHVGCKFMKNTMVKNMIKSAAMKGQADAMLLLADVLKAEISTILSESSVRADKGNTVFNDDSGTSDLRALSHRKTKHEISLLRRLASSSPKEKAQRLLS